MDRELADRELSIAKKLDTIDPLQMYHMNVINSCVPITKPDCDVTDTNDTYQIVYQYGGIDLHTYISKGLNVDAYTFLYGFANVFKAIRYFGNHGIYHNDLHAGNILVLKTENRYKFRLIDFNEGYPLATPDTMLLYGDILKIKDKIQIKQMLLDNSYKFPDYINHVDDIVRDILDSSNVKEVIIEEANIYNVGLLLQQILERITVPTELLSDFKRVINLCTHINPFKRATARQAYDYYKHIILSWKGTRTH